MFELNARTKNTILNLEMQPMYSSPGWIVVFTHHLLQNHRFNFSKQSLVGIDIAKKMGNCVWKKGLLKKGLGLCHGIGGNGLALKSLYNVTRPGMKAGLSKRELGTFWTVVRKRIGVFIPKNEMKCG